MKKMIILIFLSLSIICKAPNKKTLYIEISQGVNPFEKIWEATCQVESSNNPKADIIDTNGKRSKGIVQIQQIRVDDYNKRTGKKYKHNDVLDPIISKEIFMYYASRGNLYDMDKIIRDWNGSGPMTYDYLKKVKSKLIHL